MSGLGVENDLNAITLSHPKIIRNANRLDLITHDMMGLSATIADRPFFVCDLSETGFSYCQEVPLKNSQVSFEVVKERVNKVASSNYGKKLKYTFFYQNKKGNSGSLEVHGTIKNHMIFLVLEPEDIERELTAYLFNRAIKRSNDPKNFYGKLDLLMKKVNRLIKNDKWDLHHQAALNATFYNMVVEIGARDHEIAQMYDGYRNRQVYVKYGIQIDNPKEGSHLFTFAKEKNTEFLKKETEEILRIQHYIEALNTLCSSKEFVIKVWHASLKHFGLDPNMKLPPLDKKDFTARLKTELNFYNGQIEKFADMRFRDGSSTAIDQYLCSGLYLTLVERDKKYLNIEAVISDVRKISENLYKEMIDDLIAKDR